MNGDLSGRGLLLVWTDVAPALEAEFNAWYDRDHVRERVSGPDDAPACLQFRYGMHAASARAAGLAG